MRGILPNTLYLHRAQLYSIEPRDRTTVGKFWTHTHARIFVNRGLIRFGFGEGSKKYGKCAELYSYLLYDVVRASESSISSSPAVQHPEQQSSIQSIQQSSRPADTSIQALQPHPSCMDESQRSFRRPSSSPDSQLTTLSVW